MKCSLLDCFTLNFPFKKSKISFQDTVVKFLIYKMALVRVEENNYCKTTQ